MKLKEWQEKKRLKNKELASLLRCHESLISRIHSGKRKPSLDLAARIIKETNGEISITDLI